MGKLEKIVVLGVLFLISLIMVLSLTTGGVEDPAPAREPLESRVAQLPVDGSAETSTPLERPGDPSQDQAPTGADSPGAPAVSPMDEAMGDVFAEPVTEPSAELGLLNSSVAAPEQDVTELAPRLTLQADWDLKSIERLEPSNHPDFLIHRCVAGDSYEKLARTLYGDAAKAELLRRNNEGLKALAAGLEILVPVRDDRGPDAGDYVVQDGESLWVISKQFYGKGSRWGEIFEANRDLLDSPEAVRAGMTLRIP